MEGSGPGWRGQGQGWLRLKGLGWMSVGEFGPGGGTPGVWSGRRRGQGWGGPRRRAGVRVVSARRSGVTTRSRQAPLP